MDTILAIIFYIIFMVLCIGLFAFLLGGSLVVGAVGGLVIGTFKGFKNYFSALIENLRLRK